MLLFCLLLTISPLFPAQAAVQSLPLTAGKSIYVLKADALPLVELQLTFRDAGAISDPKGKAGRAFFATALLKEGSGKMDAVTFQKALEDQAIDISVAASDEDVTITVQSLSKNLLQALDLLQQMLTSPRFDKASLEKTRSQILSGMKQNAQNPGWLASTHFDAEAYGDHPFALPVEGTEKSVKALTEADLRDWVKELGVDNLVLSAAGDVDETLLKTRLGALLVALPAKAALPPVTDASVIVGRDKPVIITQDIPQTVALFGLPSVDRNDPDFYAAYVMNHILGGGGLTGRLSSTIRQQHGLAYYASTSLAPRRHSSALFGNFATRNESAMQAVALAEGVLKNFAETGATPQEVQNAIDYITGSFPLALDDLGSQVAYLSSMQRFDLGLDYLQKRNDYFRAVTPEAVSRVAAKLLAKPPLVVLVGNPEGAPHD